MSSSATQGRRLIETRLGWTLLEHRLQAKGAQLGKDIQTRFRTDEGREFSWHIECKSHKAGSSVTKEEVLPKLFDVWRSAHPIDVWCAALAHVELGNAIDEMLAALAEELELPFSIARLSPAEGAIDRLFACEPDLYRSLYGSDPEIDDEEIDRRVKAFEQLVLDKSHERRTPRDGRWRLVVPGSLQLATDDDRLATAYLRGYEPGSWEAVAYAWAVPRPSSADPLVDRLKGAAPGFTHTWLIGPAGEGKSTLLHEIALRLAEDEPNSLVFWASASAETVRLPVEWIDLLPAGSRIFVLVDGTERLEGAAALRSRSAGIASRASTVASLFVDRGVSRPKSRARRDLAKWTKKTDVLEIQQMSATEASALANRLVERQLIRPDMASRAKARIAAASTSERTEGTSWLLPTMLELTDPAGRNFEQILESVLIELKADGHYDAALLLLTGALVQASNGGLPNDIGALLCESAPGGLTAVLDALATELTAQRLRVWDRTRQTLAELVTHHRVVAEAFVAIGITSTDQRNVFTEACANLAAVGVNHLDEFGDLPPHHFHILNEAESYLVHQLHAYEQGASLLREWIQLDPNEANFLAMHRLAVCYRDWLTELLAAPQPDMEFARNLAVSARDVFQWSLETAARVLAEPEKCSPRMRRDPVRQAKITYHAWAALEDVVGQHLEGRRAFLQALLLSLLSFSPTDSERQVLAAGMVAFQLIHLGEYELAAATTSALIELDAANYTLPNLRSMLRQQRVDIPTGGLQLLRHVIAECATRLLLPEDPQIPWPSNYEQRIRCLDQLLDDAEKWVGQGGELAAARRMLVAAL